MSNPDGKKSYLDWGYVSDWNSWPGHKARGPYRRYMRRYWSRKIRMQGREEIKQQLREEAA